MQLERKRKDLAAQGINIAAISYDDVAILKEFGERVGIGFPMLSDKGSKVIRALGVLNTTVPPDHNSYGIPNPGEYLVNPDGTVRAKYFEENYRDRFTAGQILVRELGAEVGSARREVETDHLTARTWASDEVIRGGNRVALVLEVDLKEKMHVYAPGVEDYIAVDWTMEPSQGLSPDEPEFPASETLFLPAISESVPVYQGRFRAVRDLTVGQPNEVKHLLDEDGKLLIKGSLRYQACDDKVCYFPETIDLEWRFTLEDHDRTRAGEQK